VSCWCVVPLAPPAHCLSCLTQLPLTHPTVTDSPNCHRMNDQNKLSLSAESFSVPLASELMPPPVPRRNKRQRLGPARFRSSSSSDAAPCACGAHAEIAALKAETAALRADVCALFNATDDRHARAENRADRTEIASANRAEAFDREFDKRADFEAARRADIVNGEEENCMRFVDSVLEEVAEQVTGLKGVLEKQIKDLGSSLEKKFRAAIKAEGDVQGALIEAVEEQLVYQLNAVERVSADRLEELQKKVEVEAYKLEAVEDGTAADLARLEDVGDRLEDLAEKQSNQIKAVEKDVMEEVRANHALATTRIHRVEVLADRNKSSVKLEKNYQDGLSDDTERCEKALQEADRQARAALTKVQEVAHENRVALNRVEDLVAKQVNEMKTELVRELKSALGTVSERVN
jgi:hypothetical protein